MEVAIQGFNWLLPLWEFHWGSLPGGILVCEVPQSSTGTRTCQLYPRRHSGDELRALVGLGTTEVTSDSGVV